MWCKEDGVLAGSYSKGVDKSAESGIIKENNFSPLSDSEVVNILRSDSEKWIKSLSSEEIRTVKKYTKNSNEIGDDKFYFRLNAMLRGDIPKNDRLNYYSEQLSNAIGKFSLKHDIVCYRSLDKNPFVGMKLGDEFSFRQFTSTSVSKKGALKNDFNITIYVPKGSNGAYVESLSRYKKQREFLLDKKCNYRVKSLSNNSAVLEVIV